MLPLFSCTNASVYSNIQFCLGENVNCALDSDCAMKNSDCIDDGSETNNKVCKCKKGFLFIKDDCLKEGITKND